MSLNATSSDDLAQQISAGSPTQNAVDTDGPTADDFSANSHPTPPSQQSQPAPQPAPPAQPQSDQTQAILSGGSTPAPRPSQPSTSPAPTPQLVDPNQGTINLGSGLMSHIKGFLYGLGGGGIPGAVTGAISPKTIQNAVNKQQMAQNNELNFESARAQSMYAQALHDHLLNAELSDENKAKASERAINFVDQIRQLDPNIPTPTITEANLAATQAVTKNLQTQNGGQIPATFSVPIPSPDGQPSYVATINLSAAAQSKTPPGYLREYADKYGLDANMLSQQWTTGNTDKRAALASQALSALHPQLDTTNPLGQILALQGVKRQWVYAHTGRPDVDADDLAAGKQWFDNQLDMLQSQYADIKSAIAEQNKITNQQTQAKSEATGEYQKNLADAAQAQSTANLNNQISGTVGAGSNAGTNVNPNTGANEAYLSTLPPATQQMLRTYGEGRAELSPSMLRSKEGQLMFRQLAIAYPTFDQSRAQSYFAMRKDFTSGKTSVGINSYNTAIAHLGTMFDHVSDTNSAQLNNPFSTVNRQLQEDNQLVSTELAKAVSNGNMTEGEKKDILSSIKGYTVGSYQDRIREAVTLLNGKLESFQQQWNNGAPPGAVSQVHILSPDSEATIAKIKGQPSASISVTAPNGKTYTFPNQAQADTFKQKAGIQ